MAFLLTGLPLQKQKSIVYSLKCTKQWSWKYIYLVAEKTINNWFLAMESNF